MEDRVKLNVLGISYSPMQTGAFAMLLAEENGPRRIPVVIGSSEAQSIAIKLEGVATPRPITHDLFCAMAASFDIELKEVYIYKFEDGIFSSELRFVGPGREVAIDARTSDAVAIAIRMGAPIYTTQQIMSEVSTIFEVESDGSKPAEQQQSKPLDQMPNDQLREMMNKCIEEENYEEAARISAILKNRQE
ncbi:MAG: bifunctional nuclease family protein [Muribaculaceae bacterium]|nr:bifunctional nuclease family protein [Muribaculaceae bacterium]